MNIIAWNVRGLNKVYNHKELKVFLQENKVGVIVITETRVKENNAAQVVMKIAKNLIWHNNYVEDPGGRISIIWNPSVVKFQLLCTHMQVIDDSIKDNKAPGGDAFDALFYKKTLPLMGKEITQAVLHFFDTGVMCEAINCALITLI
ncbi:hypothetical protein KY290_001191 [Solanum tuberosum]|uniref:Uncharacterized protein n=1 Tax=Solanum tuberosum TaxID=4113 RepID=A0ABQ7WLK1_SOLTU|nr:hypothetical protein KY290_001191 [Solanum tuberosum]